MKKIVVATHHKLAEGFKNTLNYIAPNTVEVLAINGYVENESIESQIEEVLNQFESDDQMLVFTDLLGGSVNQSFAKLLSDKNIKLIAGVNLPVLLTLALKFNVADLNDDDIRSAIDEAREQIVYVNDVLSGQSTDDLDE